MNLSDITAVSTWLLNSLLSLFGAIGTNWGYIGLFILSWPLFIRIIYTLRKAIMGK